LQNTEIARDFATYYELYRRYNEIYKIPEILEGSYPEDLSSIRGGAFDEKLSIIGLLVDKLMDEFREYSQAQAVQKTLFETIKELGAELSGGKDEEKLRDGESVGADTDTGHNKRFEHRASDMEKKLSSDMEAGLLSREEEKIQRLVIAALYDCSKACAATAEGSQLFEAAKKWFTERESKRQDRIKSINIHLSNSFDFLEKTFGDEQSLTGSQEMVIFLTELSKAYYSLKFVKETGNEAYYKYNKLLLLNDRRQELKEMVSSLNFSEI
jgi:hypothetical protein